MILTKNFKGLSSPLMIANIALFGLGCGDGEIIQKNFRSKPSGHDPHKAQLTSSCPDQPSFCDPKAGQSCSGHMSLSNEGKIRYYRNYALGKTNCLVNRAVIVIHGTNRNASDYFQRMMEAADLAGAEKESLILAPHFTSVDDPSDADVPQWSSGGWKIGDKSQSKSGIGRISSFQVIDEMITKLMDRDKFANLSRIVVIGHSAGGQFVQRFAVGSPGKSISMRYIVSNPSSYVYTGKSRPKNATSLNSQDPTPAVSTTTINTDWMIEIAT